MSEQPIKPQMMDTANRMHWLSDEMIDDMCDALIEGGVWQHRADGFRAAIRALRDRAKAVVDSADAVDVGASGVASTVDSDALAALCELLPEPKP